MDSLDANNVIAERVRQSLEVFPKKFRELGEGGELQRLLDSHYGLSGPRVQQSPEDFTEQYLIEPILHALEYFNPTSKRYQGEGPHFVRRPTTFSKIEPKQPDYLMKNVDDGLVCILEAKAANREQMDGAKTDATDDVKSYVESDTFCKYLFERERTTLVAVGTDGVRWTLWWKNLESGQTWDANPKVDLSPVIASIARRHDVIAGEPELSTRECRDYLREKFVPFFSARSIAEHVETESTNFDA
ncbi:hypothetical protein [Haloferax profundi]|nr:hypothetical protein [Haloferax profundi]